MRLYADDLHGALRDDGLERGWRAVEFISGLAGSGAYFSSFGLRRLGYLLQIVDDVLDIEADVANDEANCLLGPHASLWLDLLGDNERNLLELFSSDPVMRFVLSRAMRKAWRVAEQRAAG